MFFWSVFVSFWLHFAMLAPRLSDSRSQYSLLDDSNIPDIYYATPETPTLPRMATGTAVTPIGPTTNTVGGELQLPGRYID